MSDSDENLTDKFKAWLDGKSPLLNQIVSAPEKFAEKSLEEQRECSQDLDKSDLIETIFWYQRLCDIVRTDLDSLLSLENSVLELLTDVETSVSLRYNGTRSIPAQKHYKTLRGLKSTQELVGEKRRQISSFLKPFGGVAEGSDISLDPKQVEISAVRCEPLLAEVESVAFRKKQKEHKLIGDENGMYAAARKISDEELAKFLQDPDMFSGYGEFADHIEKMAEEKNVPFPTSKRTITDGWIGKADKKILKKDKRKKKLSESL